MFSTIRVPKPSYLLSRLSSRQGPDKALYQILVRLAESYQLGEIQACQRAPHSASLNFVVTTARGKFIFRQHRLSKDAVTYEHQVLGYLQQRDFPAPRMRTNRDGQPWSVLDGSLYSVYEFVAGYCPTNFWWSSAGRQKIIFQCGRTLGKYHQAVAGLMPSAFKWNGYSPTQQRWREGEWFRQSLADVRLVLQKSDAANPVDDFTRSRIDALDKMLQLESVVEQNADLSKLVIHGDYSPWNVLFRSKQPPVVLDFNESRLDLKIYDVILATFWYAWRNDQLDQDRARAFQSGYCEAGQLHSVDVALAALVFQWIMARSLVERLHKHYLEQRPLKNGTAGLERQYQMCVFAAQQPQRLVANLNSVSR